MPRKNRGFTLIEVLVVALIIGVLAAIAWPQFTRAKEKSVAATAVAMMNDVHTAMNVSAGLYGVYPTAINASTLDLDYPSTAKTATTLIGKYFTLTLVSPTTTSYSLSVLRTGMTVARYGAYTITSTSTDTTATIANNTTACPGTGGAACCAAELL